MMPPELGLGLHRAVLADEDDFDGWRNSARNLAELGVSSSSISWEVAGGQAGLFPGPDGDGLPVASSFAVPRSFVDLARTAICHSDPERFALLYVMR